jgi:hypothetical protein
VVSGIEPCRQELLEELSRLIDVGGEGPIENDCDTCPECGQATFQGYGLNTAQVWSYRICTNEHCDFSDGSINLSATDIAAVFKSPST